MPMFTAMPKYLEGDTIKIVRGGHKGMIGVYKRKAGTTQAYVTLEDDDVAERRVYLTSIKRRKVNPPPDATASSNQDTVTISRSTLRGIITDLQRLTLTVEQIHEAGAWTHNGR